MSTTDYENECLRAELLGEQPPTWDEFKKRQEELQAERAGQAEEDEAVFTENATVLAEQGEGIKTSLGGVEELNTILARTQIKINKFRSVCGSFTNLLRTKNWRGEEVAKSEDESSSSMPATPMRTGGVSTDMETQVAGQVDRLDSLLNKTERAEISMTMQNKQMKSYLKN